MSDQAIVLVFDVGPRIIGIQRPHRGRYVPYYGDMRIRALQRIEEADEIVTYNGNNYDLIELGKLSIKLRDKEFVFSGIHTDMREKCWPNILGSCLSDSFRQHIYSNKTFPDTFEGSNRKDVYMTLMLWRYWKEHGEFT